MSSSLAVAASNGYHPPSTSIPTKAVAAKNPVWGTHKLRQEDSPSFTSVFADIGLAYIASGKGDIKSEMCKKLASFWDDYNRGLPQSYLKVIPSIESKQQIQNFMTDIISKLNQAPEITSAKITSTFSLSMIIEVQGQKYVASAHVGNNTLLHLDQDGTISYITPEDKNHLARELNLFSLKNDSPVYFNLRQVQSGDKIYGFTNAITDSLSSESLHDILKDPAVTDYWLLSTITSKVTTLTRDKPCSGFITAFVMPVS